MLMHGFPYRGEMEQHYHNAAILPISLEKLLYILHLVRCGVGFLLFCFGIGAVIYYEAFVSFYVLVQGIIAILSGITGVLATKFKILAGHGGCVGTSAVTLYLGIFSYTTSFSVTAAMPSQGTIVALLMCVLIIIAIDVLLSALVLGFEAIVLYISTKRPA